MPKPAVPNSVITGPAAWMGKDMEQNTDAWLRHLSAKNITDLENAAEFYQSLDKDVGEITKEDFPLDEFAKTLKDLNYCMVLALKCSAVYPSSNTAKNS
jgi:hypothetical protein